MEVSWKQTKIYIVVRVVMVKSTFPCLHVKPMTSCGSSSLDPVLVGWLGPYDFTDFFDVHHTDSSRTCRLLMCCTELLETRVVRTHLHGECLSQSVSYYSASCALSQILALVRQSNMHITAS